MGRLRTPGPVTRGLIRALAVFVVFVAVNQNFNLGFFVGVTLLENRYLYAILGLALPLVFLIYPHRSRTDRMRIPWFDWLLAIASAAAACFFIYYSLQIVTRGWDMAPPASAIVVGAVLWTVVVEAGRRAGGAILAVIVGLVSLYPMVADLVPDPLAAFPYSPSLTAAYHAMGGESILGIPLRAFANLIIGFIIFGAALQHTGGGRFFINFALALLGHVRGGPAKVSIFSSGLMGSMSGSVVTNVMTTGVMTIPAMRRIGMSGTFAAGVETAASTGGVLMPPVMGATAFVMANLLGIPYADVALAALIPSILFFFGLFVQIDARSARERLSGLPKSELPSVIETLREGWHYVFAFGLLIFMLLVLRRETLAPYFAAPLLILTNQIFSKRTRWGLTQLWDFLDSLAELFANLVAILAAVGLIVGALSMTGLAGTLVNDLLRIAGGAPIFLLLMGAITSLVLGIGMTSTAAYIFLAILLAPALIQSGLDALAVHMFIFYWGMLSFITPPVALGAFAAASVAGTPPMRTGFEAMKLGSVMYLIPFFFVFEPSLVLAGPVQDILIATTLALIGIYVFAGAMQGYLAGVGPLFASTSFGWLPRLALMFAAVLIALPGDTLATWTDLDLLIGAAVIIVPIAGLARLLNKRAVSQHVPASTTGAELDEERS